MSEPGRIDPSTAEHLIRGARADVPGTDPLARLLAAAASPARPGELVGEPAAMTAFRAAKAPAAPATPAAPKRRGFSTVGIALARMPATKAAFAVLALSAGGSLALATGGGRLPGVGTPDHHPSSRRHSSAVVSRPATHSTASAHSPGPAASTTAATGRTVRPRTSATGRAPSTPDLKGLCTAFRAVGANPGQALDGPAFTVLIDAAGGRGHVKSYCAKMLATAPGPAIEHPGKPHGHPSGPPTDGPKKKAEHAHTVGKGHKPST